MPIPKDHEGYLGRECPQQQCEGYFKVRPGTGLTGTNLPCTCPYCGYTGPADRFWTKDQVEYAKSVALRDIVEGMRTDLKKLEFNHKPQGGYGIGISMKVEHGPPLPIRHYRERALETKIACDQCTLQYSVYGLFAYCPDCTVHNSLQILRTNLDLTRRQLALAQTLLDAELRRHLIEDALENCVSAFDGFARETCRIRAHKSSDPARAQSLSFQHLNRAAAQLRTLFDIDLPASIPATDWSFGHVGFMRRHLLAHNAGVIDQKYLDETGELRTLLGRRLVITLADVDRLAGIVVALGESVIALLPKPQ